MVWPSDDVIRNGLDQLGVHWATSKRSPDNREKDLLAQSQPFACRDDFLKMGRIKIQRHCPPNVSLGPVVLAMEGIEVDLEIRDMCLGESPTSNIRGVVKEERGRVTRTSHFFPRATFKNIYTFQPAWALTRKYESKFTWAKPRYLRALTCQITMAIYWCSIFSSDITGCWFPPSEESSP